MSRNVVVVVVVVTVTALPLRLVTVVIVVFGAAERDGVAERFGAAERDGVAERRSRATALGRNSRVPSVAALAFALATALNFGTKRLALASTFA